VTVFHTHPGVDSGSDLQAPPDAIETFEKFVPLFRGEVFTEVLFVLHRQPHGCSKCDGSVVGDMQSPTPAIGWMASSFDKPKILEVVDQGDQRARRDTEFVTHGVLSDALRLCNRSEERELSRVKSGRRDRLAELSGDDQAELREDEPHGRTERSALTPSDADA
jgi:hypothetical protein